MHLFHDERVVRERAFEALCAVVDEGLSLLEDEVCFDSISRFQGFAEFEERILGATHTEFVIPAKPDEVVILQSACRKPSVAILLRSRTGTRV